MKPAVNGYDLSRAWFDFAFENNDKVDCKHTAMYFYCIDLNNRLGWKEKFGLPTDQTMDALSIRNHRTYSKIFQDIVDWGFINVIKKSVNQHSSTIIALCKNTKASTTACTNAHTKAIQRHVQMQEQKQQQGTATIDKQENIKTLNNKTSIINNTLAEQSSAYKNLEKSKESKVFKKPTLIDVVEYFKINGYDNSLAERAFNFYDCANWKDSKGKQVKNWKQKMQGVWFKEENKTKQTSLNEPLKMVY